MTNDNEFTNEHTAAHPHNATKPAVILSIFVILTTALIIATAAFTHDAIEHNQQQRIVAQLDEVFPTNRRNNDIVETSTIIDAPSLTSGAPVTMYQPQLNGDVTGIIFSMSTGEGYNGTVRLLIGIDDKGLLTGVRVIPPHQETPGLGDKIEIRKSDWILEFNGKSLRSPPPEGWAVKKDGGEFDQFTGATITPRAVIAAVKSTLDYFHANRTRLLTPLMDLNA